jgi:cyclophilin family peptidyl-prolyl cis-trans isomerase
VPSEKRQRKRQNAQLRHQVLAQQQRKANVRRRAITAVIVIALFAGVVALITAANSGGDDDTDVASTATTVKGATTTTTKPEPAVAPECPPADGSAEKHQKFTKAFDMCIDPAKTYTAEMETDAGTITITLDAKKAPKTVNNFVSLARYHYYDGIVFHRVIPGFVVQGGDPTGTGRSGPGYTFEDELPKPEEYKAGSLAMANSGADTNGSQFFIVTSDEGAKTLVEAVGGTANYSLFGQVTAGMDVVKKIEADGAQSGTPKVTHKIVKVAIKEA